METKRGSGVWKEQFSTLFITCEEKARKRLFQPAININQNSNLDSYWSTLPVIDQPVRSHLCSSQSHIKKKTAPLKQLRCNFAPLFNLKRTDNVFIYFGLSVSCRWTLFALLKPSLSRARRCVHCLCKGSWEGSETGLIKVNYAIKSQISQNLLYLPKNSNFWTEIIVFLVKSQKKQLVKFVANFQD